MLSLFRDHSFSTYSNFSAKLTFLSTLTCAYQGVRNVSFQQKNAYVLNKWSHKICSASKNLANYRKYSSTRFLAVQYIVVIHFLALVFQIRSIRKKHNSNDIYTYNWSVALRRIALRLRTLTFQIWFLAYG